ncbi:MAG: dihydroorotase [Kiritimatiellales bacterium]
MSSEFHHSIIPPFHRSILLKNAKVVSDGEIRAADVFIRNGRIDRIDSSISAPADIEINAEGKALLPGMIDCHVHFREPGLTHKGSLHSESRAAVAGGVTSVMDMPNTVPQTTSIERLEEKSALAAQTCATNFSFYLGAAGSHLDEIKKLNPADVCGVKIFMGSSTGNMLVDGHDVLEEIFRAAPVPLAAHCEDANIIAQNETIFREKLGDKTPFRAHPEIRSEEACYASTKLAVELARKYGTRLHVLHISTARELNLFDESIARVGGPRENEAYIENDECGKHITAETCIHYLHFDDAAYDRLGARVKCNPAIKTSADRAALIRGLLTNQIDTIGTDHAPHTAAEKSGTYWTAPSGLPLIQSALPAILEHFHDGILSLETVAEKTAHAPARIFNIAGRGFIREGYFADLVLVDLNRPQTVAKKNILYQCGWSPFEGNIFRSTIDTTIVSGQIVWQDEAIHAGIFGQRLKFER